MWVVKTDNIGTMEWDVVFGGDGDDIVSSLLQTSDEGIIVAGYSNSPSTNRQDLYLVKLNNDGDIVWHHEYTGDENKSVRKIVSTTDGDVILGGSTTSKQSTTSDLFLQKVTEFGEIEWMQRYNIGKTDYLTDFLETADNGFILSGMTSIKFNIHSETDLIGFIAKTDFSGNLVWKYTFDTFPNFYYNTSGSVIHSLAQAGNFVYVFGELLPHSIDWCEYTECLHHATFLLKIDLNGNLIFNNPSYVRCAPYNWLYYDDFIDMVLSPSGEILIVGNGNRFRDPTLWITNELNSKLGEFHINGTYNYSKPVFKAITSDNNGHFIVAGETNTRSINGLSRDVLLLEISDNGELGWFSIIGESGFFESNGRMELIHFPTSNPSSSSSIPFLNLSFINLLILVLIRKKLPFIVSFHRRKWI
ncbi:MAG: hypothetical protein ACFFFH_10615 [Candidatus Thorarchaeota archaeon]